MKIKKSIEAIYQKKTLVEHALLRPETYIGSVETVSDFMWILHEAKNTFENKKIEYCPGLYKIFDEILVNAADNFQRDHKMKRIDVDINKTKGLVSVRNDGEGIPIVIHKEHKIYVAQLIFGHLLTGSNYEDNDRKVTGGRNGYGAKLANIFSKMFELETGDGKLKKELLLTWKDNMSKMEGPIITQNPQVENYTKITFRPDFKKFGMAEFSDDMIHLMMKRVYDLAGTVGVKVHLNGQLLKIKSFQDYVNCYTTEPVICLESSKRWKIYLQCSESQFQQVSFVNSICTYKGGSHINYIMDQIVTRLIDAVSKKAKKMEVKPAHVKSFFFLFVSCQIENPTFDSQTKENLMSKPSQYGSQFVLSEKSMKQILNTGIVDRIINSVNNKDTAKLSKQLKKKKGDRMVIPKLEDANNAGRGGNCTLILTEGDSAKALAVCGLAIVGRDNYGVFPLRGKLLNVNQISPKQISQNEELKNIVQIMGLQFNKQYYSTKDLRYQTIMIMADQDNDGSHIKGLILNFLATFWPSLCKIEGFLKEFITPILKCRKGNQVVSFFTQQDYESWKNKTLMTGWSIKYYKGLGTSTSAQGHQYFSHLNNHQITFVFQEECFRNLDMAFGKKLAQMRRDWLQNYNPKLTVNHNKKFLTVADFVNRELIHFSNADNIRSIPSLVDGLKPSQRKILYSCFKRNLKKEIKVAQLAGYVAEHSLYHHGEQSLCQTIITLAQDFVGSNNLNLLMPIGQFGTRNMGGKDSASARYIFTHLNPLTRLLFPEADDHIVEYLEQDNTIVEPKYYYPILPLILINGAEGIGTGWSTSLSPHKVKDVIRMVKDKLQGIDNVPKIGWENFKGQVIQNSNDSKGGYTVKGIYTVRNDVVTVTQLPVKKWVSDYKSFLEQKIATSENKETAELEDLKQFHKDNDVKFVLSYLDGQMPDDIEKSLKLSVAVHNNNMVLFDSDIKLKKYEQTLDILNQFYHIRTRAYDLRRRYLVTKTKRQMEIAQTKCKFIKEVTSGVFSLKGSREDWTADLKKSHYKSYDQFTRVQSTKIAPQEEDTDTNLYSYLLNQPIWTFSRDKLLELEQTVHTLRQSLEYYSRATVKDMWLSDIREFQKLWDQLNPSQGNGSSSPEKKRVSPKKKTPSKKRQLSSASAKECVEISDSSEQIIIEKLPKRRRPQVESSSAQQIQIEDNDVTPTSVPRRKGSNPGPILIQIQEQIPVKPEHPTSPRKAGTLTVTQPSMEKSILQKMKQKYMTNPKGTNQNVIQPHPSLLEQPRDNQS